MDVRHLVYNSSYILPNLKKSNQNDDDLALEVLKFVKKKLTYNSDQNLHNKLEYWQDPEYTFQKNTGDCEDGALLIASLLRIAGVPAYKVKICAGWVKTSNGKSGHAYCIYLAENNKWYVLDWCYYGNQSINYFKKKPHKDLSNYQEVWWTFNDKYAWSEHNLV
jgi:predicted transglutaminase-like cysteine proteinase